MPRSLKTFVTASGMPRRIRTKVAELCEQSIEVGCAFLGVPKFMSSTSSRRYGAWLPGAFTSLASCSGPEVVLLCAPVTETEWYCLSEQSALTIDGLFVADMGCEVHSVTPEVLDRGTRMQDIARSRQEEFSAIVLVAAFRAEVERARLEARRAHVHNFNDYAEPSPVEWPTREGWESQTSLWMLWMWRASGAWQYALHHQRMDHVLCQGVAVPKALVDALEEARGRCDDICENRLESIAMQEMRAAAARAMIRKDEGAAKKLILDMVAAGCDDLDILTDDGRTLMMIAASFGSRSLVQLLLEKRAAANAHGSDGRAALHYATGRASVDVMRDLLSARADPHTTSTTGRTACSDARTFAASSNFDDIRKTLRDYGFVEYACEKRLWATQRLCNSSDSRWRADMDIELMPMEGW